MGRDPTFSFPAGGVAAAALTLLLCRGLAATPFFELTWLAVILPFSLTAVLLAAQLLHAFEWRRASEARSLTLSAAALGGGSLAAHLAIYGLWWAREILPAGVEQPLRGCTHNFAVISSLVNCIVLSMRWRHPGAMVLQALLQPLATLDRVPLACELEWVEVVGRSCWPRWHDHFACLYGMWAAVCVLRGPEITLTVSSARAAKRDGFATTVERLQQVCAFLSLSYLLICWQWMRIGHTVLLDTAYHVAWSFLRPCYVALFLVYWLKRLPLLRGLQALVCGLGFGYFLVFCAVAETDMTAVRATRLAEAPGHLTDLGKAGHRVEAFGFYASMLLFFVHGICGGQWAAIGPRFQSPLLGVGLLQCCLVVLCELNQIHVVQWWEPVEESNFLLGFVVAHYGLYTTILLASTYVLQRRDDPPITHEVRLSFAGPDAEDKGAVYGTVDI